MESPNSNDSDALSEYASQLEDRVAKLEKRLAEFSIAGVGITGNIEEGFNYLPPDSMGEQPEGPE